MLLQHLIAAIYVSIIQKDWMDVENLFDKHFRVLDANKIPEFNTNDYYINDKYESLFL